MVITLTQYAGTAYTQIIDTLKAAIDATGMYDSTVTDTWTDSNGHHWKQVTVKKNSVTYAEIAAADIGAVVSRYYTDGGVSTSDVTYSSIQTVSVFASIRSAGLIADNGYRQTIALVQSHADRNMIVYSYFIGSTFMYNVIADDSTTSSEVSITSVPPTTPDAYLATSTLRGNSTAETIAIPNGIYYSVVVPSDTVFPWTNVAYPPRKIIVGGVECVTEGYFVIPE